MGEPGWDNECEDLCTLVLHVTFEPEVSHQNKIKSPAASTAAGDGSGDLITAHTSGENVAPFTYNLLSKSPRLQSRGNLLGWSTLRDFPPETSVSPSVQWEEIISA